MAHLTNFSFELCYKIFTEDASLPRLYHGAKKSKMTKNSNQRGSCRKYYQLIKYKYKYIFGRPIQFSSLFRPRLDGEGSVAEGLLGSSLFGGVGSNRTAASRQLFFYFCKRSKNALTQTVFCQGPCLDKKKKPVELDRHFVMGPCAYVIVYRIGA